MNLMFGCSAAAQLRKWIPCLGSAGIVIDRVSFAAAGPLPHLPTHFPQPIICGPCAFGPQCGILPGALNEKLVAAEMKKLKKESLLLQDQVDAFDIKTYSGIWKDDVTTAEWLSKHGSIQAKKDYCVYAAAVSSILPPF